MTAGIWDGGQLSDDELKNLQGFCSRMRAPGGRVVALFDFPRLEHVESMRAMGVCAMFGKPYVVDEVLAAFLV